MSVSIGPQIDRFSRLLFFGRWYFWIHTPWWSAGILRDDGSPLLFSERYGHTKVWRWHGIKLKWRPSQRKSASDAE